MPYNPFSKPVFPTQPSTEPTKDRKHERFSSPRVCPLRSGPYDHQIVLNITTRVFLGTFSVLGMQAKEKPSPPFPIDLGVSLIFPQPNETYRPVYPFPIVFALTGATKAGFKLQWRLEGNWTTPIKKEDVPIVYGSAPDWLYSSGSLDPATEPYFVINATGIMGNTSYTEWELGWSLSVLQECSPGPERYWKYGSINFSTSSSGLLPNYKPKGPCPLEIQHTRFLDNRTTPKG